MNNNLKEFTNGEMVVNATEVNGEISFLIDDVARGAGFTYTRKDRGNKEFIRWETVNSYLQELGYFEVSQKVATGDLIPEQWAYLLMMKGNSEKAQKFQKWLAFEVVPNLRKDGIYMAGEDTMDEDELIYTAMKRMSAKIERQREELKAVKPKADYLDTIIESNSTFTTTDVAKELGMSAISLNRILRMQKVIFKQGESYYLYSKYHNKDYANTKTIKIVSSRGIETRHQLRWTEKGRAFIITMLCSQSTNESIKQLKQIYN